MKFLSLGAGVQSSTMLMLAIQGEIERPDHVIFADTGLEPNAVYKHLGWLRRRCDDTGIPFHTVKAKLNMLEEFNEFATDDKKYFNQRPPFYTITKKGTAQLQRQCTRDGKIKPIQRKQLQLMGYKTRRGVPDGAAVSMIGISTDEARRAGVSRESWYERVYPLIDPLKMSRADCQAWWDKHYPNVVLPSSSCIICPFHRDDKWLELKTKYPKDWQRAVNLDNRMRNTYERRTNQQVFLHRSCQPLQDVDFNDDQLSLGFDDELYCGGGCGL